MEIIRLLKENDYDLTKILNLSDFTEGQLALIRNLILSAYKEGFEDGEAEVRSDLDEFLRFKTDK